MQALERLNQEADRIDARAGRDLARRAEEARSLRARCAPYRAVLDLDEPPEPVPVVGLSTLACAVLALVAHFVRLGYAGLQAARKDLAWRYDCSDSSVKRALAELRLNGWLVVTPDYVPAEESALAGRYVSTSGKFRSLRSDADEAYANSRVRNLYTLGTKAHAAGFGRCGKPEENRADPAGDPATFSALFSGSGSGSGSASLPRNAVDNSTVEATDGAEIDLRRQASSSPTRATHAQLVADADSAESSASDGDARGNEGEEPEMPRRGLFGAMGWRLSRIFGGGAS